MYYFNKMCATLMGCLNWLMKLNFMLNLAATIFQRGLYTVWLTSLLNLRDFKIII